MAKHDPGYKRLFSEPEMVRDLLRGFVPGQWVHRLDFSSLEKVNAQFVSEDLVWREDDVIWRVRFSDQSWLYIYLLLEFQSKPDPWMALRVMVYMGLLWQELVQTKTVASGEKLPPVVPVVLYNGTDGWNAPEELEELVVPVEGLECYRPKCRYLLLDEQRFATDEDPESIRNLVAALFRLEQSRTPEDVRRVVERLTEWLAEPEQSSLRQAFLTWLRQVILPARLGGTQVPEVNDLSEVRVMLAERVIEWTKEWKEQGQKEGELKGKRDTLLMLFERAGYSLSEEHLHQLESCDDTDQLDQWVGQLLDGDRPDDIF